MNKKILYWVSGIAGASAVGYILYGRIKRRSVVEYLTKGYSEWQQTGTVFADLKKTVFDSKFIYNNTTAKGIKKYNRFADANINNYVLRFHDELVGNSILSVLNPNVDEDAIVSIITSTRSKLNFAYIAQEYVKKYGVSLYDDLMNVGSSDVERIFDAINALPLTF